jgi:hypothetical protein
VCVAHAGARLDDFEEVAMCLAECVRAFGSCLLPDSTRKKLFPVVLKLVGDGSGTCGGTVLTECCYRVLAPLLPPPASLGVFAVILRRLTERAQLDAHRCAPPLRLSCPPPPPLALLIPTYLPPPHSELMNAKLRSEMSSTLATLGLVPGTAVVRPSPAATPASTAPMVPSMTTAAFLSGSGGGGGGSSNGAPPPVPGRLPRRDTIGVGETAPSAGAGAGTGSGVGAALKDNLAAGGRRLATVVDAVTARVTVDKPAASASGPSPVAATAAAGGGGGGIGAGGIRGGSGSGSSGGGGGAVGGGGSGGSAGSGGGGGGSSGGHAPGEHSQLDEATAAAKKYTGMMMGKLRGGVEKLKQKLDDGGPAGK